MIVGPSARKEAEPTWCSVTNKPTGYGGFREEPSKAPGQRTPAQAAESIREERFRTLPATGGRGARLGGRVNSGELP
jgi:hypothetical protein